MATRAPRGTPCLKATSKRNNASTRQHCPVARAGPGWSSDRSGRSSAAFCFHASDLPGETLETVRPYKVGPDVEWLCTDAPQVTSGGTRRKNLLDCLCDDLRDDVRVYFYFPMHIRELPQHTHKHTHTHANTHTQTHTTTNTHKHTHTHTQTNTHTHTHKHPHTPTHTHLRSPVSAGCHLFLLSFLFIFLSFVFDDIILLRI